MFKRGPEYDLAVSVVQGRVWYQIRQETTRGVQKDEKSVLRGWSLDPNCAKRDDTFPFLVGCTEKSSKRNNIFTRQHFHFTNSKRAWHGRINNEFVAAKEGFEIDFEAPVHSR